MRIFRAPRLLPVYAVIVINMFLVGILFGFLPVYLHSIGYTAVQSGTVVSMATLSYLLIQPLAGHLADTFDIRTTVLVGLLLAALSIIAVTFTSGALLMSLVLVGGVGIGTVWTNSDTLVSALVLLCRRAWYSLLALALTMGGEVLNIVLQHLFHRQRPVFEHPLVTLSSPSFPSGHAMGSALFYLLLAGLIAVAVHQWRWRALCERCAGCNGRRSRLADIMPDSRRNAAPPPHAIPLGNAGS